MHTFNRSSISPLYYATLLFISLKDLHNFEQQPAPTDTQSNTHALPIETIHTYFSHGCRSVDSEQNL
jgi:hypothetical protein